MAIQSEIQVERLNSSESLSIQTHEIDNRKCETVDARQLHLFLEAGRDFSNWMKARIKQYKFVEGEGFILISLNDQNGLSPKRLRKS
ncbi:antA/AntB antirepressor family protein [Marinomonas sp. PE14-40]|uniref:antA/AntB antirepressor family protein n=1 Tax=Marinomonas sp. PE14-40 TaxID=3060621 RepID=UPI003F6640B2